MKTIGFIGLGLIGGSIAKALRKYEPEWHLIAYDPDREALADALGVEYRPCYISQYLLDGSKTYDLKSSLHGDKHFSCIYDTSKIRKLAGDPELDIDIRKGAQLYVEYMDAHPEEKVEDEAFDKWCDETIEKYESLAEQFVEML